MFLFWTKNIGKKKLKNYALTNLLVYFDFSIKTIDLRVS